MSDSRIPNEKLKRERELRGWSQQRLAELVDTSFENISRWERGITSPQPHFREKLRKLFGKDAAALGLIDQQESDKTSGGAPKQAIPPHLGDVGDLSTPSDIQILSPQGTITIRPQTLDATPSSPSFQIVITSPAFRTIAGDALYREREMPLYDREQGQNSVYFQQVVTSPSTTTPELENAVDRRGFFREAARIGSVSVLAYHTELLERFSRALKNPSTIDERMLSYIARRTEDYWHDRHIVALPSYNLLSYVVEHLQKVTKLLEGSLPPTMRARLCSLAGGIALLAGELLYDMRCYTQAREYYRASIEAAQEANDQGLQAVAWGRMSFTWTYEGNPEEALLCVQEARRLGIRSVNTTIQAWLAAVEAEIQANLGERRASLNALDGTEYIAGETRPQDCYWIHFDRSLSAGYRGVSLLRLYRPGDPQTASFLVSAQNALRDALDFLNPTLMRRRPNLLADLAGTYVRQKEVEAACKHAIEAVKVASQIESKVVTQRLISLRHELDPWNYTEDVQNLDAQLRSLLKTG